MTVAIIWVLPYSGYDQITTENVNSMSDIPVCLSCSVHNTLCNRHNVSWTRDILWVPCGSTTEFSLTVGHSHTPESRQRDMPLAEFCWLLWAHSVWLWIHAVTGKSMIWLVMRISALTMQLFMQFWEFITMKAKRTGDSIWSHHPCLLSVHWQIFLAQSLYL